MDDMERILSLRLYDVMDNIGGSEKIRKLYQEAAMTEEIIDKISFQIKASPISAYILGSSSEGTTTLGLASDIDRVYCDENYPVLDDIANINNAPTGFSFLMLRDEETHPGYVKLQLVVDGIPRTIFDTFNELPSKYYTDKRGKICLKHFYMDMPNYDRYGPADTEPGTFGLISTDHVYALRCITIPHFVRDWLYRRRLNGWPTCDDLQSMGGLGCFVVGVGHSQFENEWRLSFSLQERLLMFSFNSTQHRCYIILKMLKTIVIQQRIQKSLSSYHCKTCMFYAIENTQTNMWKPHKLLTCIRVCFMILLTWVYKGYCPNYFVPTENMFDRPRYREIKHDLVQVLRELISELPSFILHLQCDFVGTMITDQTIRSLNNISKLKMQFGRFVATFRSVSSLSDSISLFCYKSEDLRYNCLHILHHIKRLQTTRRITEHTEQQTRNAIAYAIPALHLQLEQRLASFAFTPEVEPYCQSFLQFSLHHFREGRSTDLFTSRLLIVTLLMRLHAYDLCEKILKDVADSFKSHVISDCKCFGQPLFVEHDTVFKQLKDNNISTKMYCESGIVTCVKFLPCDREITPIPLRAEMFRSDDTPPGSRDDVEYFWFDWAVVDGKVFLYLLQYLIYSKLNRPTNRWVAIDNLIYVLNNDLSLHHKETGYNLLGWIFIQEGRSLDAMRCFMTSWRIRPHHNAAKFHIRKLAMDIMEI